MYAKKDEETLIQNQIYVHELGTDQSEDKLIYKEDDNEFNIWLSESRTKKSATRRVMSLKLEFLQYFFIFWLKASKAKHQYPRGGPHRRMSSGVCCAKWCFGL